MVPSQLNGLEHPGVLDALAHDTRADKLVLAMRDASLDRGGTPALPAAEKLNAYVSFILDGELQGELSRLASKSVEIQLRTLHDPNVKALEFISRAREQLALQQITFEIVRFDQAEAIVGRPAAIATERCYGGGPAADAPRPCGRRPLNQFGSCSQFRTNSSETPVFDHGMFSASTSSGSLWP